MWYKLGILTILLAVYLILDTFDKKQGREGLAAEKTKRVMIWISAILLIFHSGLRNIAVGPDTYAYSLKFEDSLSTSWQSIFRNFFTVYVGGEGKDAGFYLIQKGFSTIIPDFQLFLLFIALVFFYALFKVVDYYTSSKSEILLAVFVYLALFYEFFSVTGCRQVLATAFCLFSVKYIREQKVIPFILIMILAFLVHRSSLIFVPLYFISNNSKPSLIYFGALILMPVLITVSVRYATELALLSGTDLYLMYAEGGATGAQSFLVFYVVISTFLLIIQRRIIKDNRDYLLIYNAVYMAMLFIPLTYSSAALMRVVQYYSLFMTIGITFLLRKQVKNAYNGIVTIFLIVSLVALSYKLVNDNIEYKFFWQQMELPMNY